MEFRITFGVRYNHEEHTLLPGVTGKHYVTVVAVDSNQCREIVRSQIGDRWAFDYPMPEDGWEEGWIRWCPQGEFARWDITTPVSIPTYRTVRVRAVVDYAREFPITEFCQFIDCDEQELAGMTDGEVNAALAARRDDLAERLATYLEGFTITSERVRA